VRRENLIPRIAAYGGPFWEGKGVKETKKEVFATKLSRFSKSLEQANHLWELLEALLAEGEDSCKSEPWKGDMASCLR